MFIRLAIGNLEVTMMMTMVTNYKENTLTQCITIETASLQTVMSTRPRESVFSMLHYHKRFDIQLVTKCHC